MKIEGRLLTDEEHTALIVASSRDNTLSCRFGPSGVWLDDCPENQGAFDILKSMRTNPPTPGREG